MRNEFITGTGEWLSAAALALHEPPLAPSIALLTLSLSLSLSWARVPRTTVCAVVESVSPSVLQTMGGGARRVEASPASAKGEPVRRFLLVETSDRDQNH